MWARRWSYRMRHKCDGPARGAGGASTGGGSNNDASRTASSATPPVSILFTRNSRFSSCVRVERGGGCSSNRSSGIDGKQHVGIHVALQRRDLKDSDVQDLIQWISDSLLLQQRSSCISVTTFSGQGGKGSGSENQRRLATSEAIGSRVDTSLNQGGTSRGASAAHPFVLTCSLDLAENNLSGVGVSQLLEFLAAHNNVLRISKLKLYKNKIGNRGAVAVAKYISRTAQTGALVLEELHLSHCDITGNGCIALLDAVAAASIDRATFVYPRFDARRRTHVPLWLRMEYNVISEPLALVKQWSVCPRSRKGGGATLVCFADKNSNTKSQEHCTPARCCRCSGPSAPIFHMYMFSHQIVTPDVALRASTEPPVTVAQPIQQQASRIGGATPSTPSTAPATAASSCKAVDIAAARAAAGSPHTSRRSSEGDTQSSHQQRARSSSSSKSRQRIVQGQSKGGTSAPTAALATSTTGSPPTGTSTTASSTSATATPATLKQSSVLVLPTENQCASTTSTVKTSAVPADVRELQVPARRSGSDSSPPKPECRSEATASVTECVPVVGPKVARDVCPESGASAAVNSIPTAVHGKGTASFYNVQHSDVPPPVATSTSGRAAIDKAEVGRCLPLYIFLDTSAVLQMQRNRCATVAQAQHPGKCPLSLSGLISLFSRNIFARRNGANAGSSLADSELTILLILDFVQQELAKQAQSQGQALTVPREGEAALHELRRLAEFSVVEYVNALAVTHQSIKPKPHPPVDKELRRSEDVSNTIPEQGGTGFSCLNAMEVQAGLSSNISMDTLRTIDFAFLWKLHLEEVSLSADPKCNTKGLMFFLTANPVIRSFIQNVSPASSGPKSSNSGARAFLPCILLEELCLSLRASFPHIQQSLLNEHGPLHNALSEGTAPLTASDFRWMALTTLDRQNQVPHCGEEACSSAALCKREPVASVGARLSTLGSPVGGSENVYSVEHIKGDASTAYPPFLPPLLGTGFSDEAFLRGTGGELHTGKVLTVEELEELQLHSHRDHINDRQSQSPHGLVPFMPTESRDQTVHSASSAPAAASVAVDLLFASYLGKSAGGGLLRGDGNVPGIGDTSYQLDRGGSDNRSVKRTPDGDVERSGDQNQHTEGTTEAKQQRELCVAGPLGDSDPSANNWTSFIDVEMKGELINAIAIVQELSSRVRLSESSATAGNCNSGEGVLTEDLLRRAQLCVMRWRQMLLVTKHQQQQGCSSPLMSVHSDDHSAHWENSQAQQPWPLSSQQIEQPSWQQQPGQAVSWPHQVDASWRSHRQPQDHQDPAWQQRRRTQHQAQQSWQQLMM